ncbi:unnamed protein product [Lactuca virosa]|uniref:Secreted protein n=1 Tax=Lactuca virosa TaxID=75947 RepID=A0AAU9NQG0_9ASTR|nr:unnamed protein product [Lactuca virosa]
MELIFPLLLPLLIQLSGREDTGSLERGRYRYNQMLSARNANHSSLPPKPPIFDPLDSSSTLFVASFFPTSFSHLLVVDH